MKKPLCILQVKIKGEIYNRVYSIRDIHELINLFNEVHGDQMMLIIEDVKEIKMSKDV